MDLISKQNELEERGFKTVGDEAWEITIDSYDYHMRVEGNGIMVDCFDNSIEDSGEAHIRSEIYDDIDEAVHAVCNGGLLDDIIDPGDLPSNIAIGSSRVVTVIEVGESLHDIQEMDAFPDTSAGNAQAEYLFAKKLEILDRLKSGKIGKSEWNAMLDDGLAEMENGHTLLIVHSN